MARTWKLTAPVASEDEIQAAIVAALQRLLLPPAQFTALNPGGHLLSEAAKARHHRLGLQSGWPDLLIVVWGQAFGLEVKRLGGVLSASRLVHGKRGTRTVVGQRERFEQLSAAGLAIAVVHSVDEALAALRFWRLPLRPHVVHGLSQLSTG